MNIQKVEIPTFAKKEDLFSFLKKEKDSLVAQKKAIYKMSDDFTYHSPIVGAEYKSDSVKEESDYELSDIKVQVVLNTTKFMDSHDDVHLDGLWKKTLSESQFFLHLKQHEMKFESIIADGTDVEAYTKMMDWKSLGYDYEGKTEALIYESVVKRDRNEYMHEQYSKGRVKNHSVGMRYVKIEMAVNNPDMEEEYAVWEKYYPLIVNKDRADARSFFWAVKEAKLSEGSAVPKGSNTITPTLSNNIKSEPSKDTQNKGRSRNRTAEYESLFFQSINLSSNG